MLRVISGIGAFSFVVGALWAGALADGKPARVPAGMWGGQGIGFEVTEKGATVEYDCAHGTIDEAIFMKADGRFEVKGVHFRERGGPVREGEGSKGEPAVYSGKVDGDTMTLTLKLAGVDEVVGTYTLTLGRHPRIHKCA